MYKIIHGVDKMDKEKLCFPSQNIRTRSHPIKLNSDRIRAVRSNFFLHNMHSTLEIITRLAGFRKELDQFTEIMGINGY